MAINAGTRKPNTTGPAYLNDNRENYPAVGVPSICPGSHAKAAENRLSIACSACSSSLSMANRAFLPAKLFLKAQQ